jgi:hypothetical protein
MDAVAHVRVPHRVHQTAERHEARERVHQTVTAVIGREMIAGRNPDEMPREVLLLLDDMEGLLSGKVLNYAVRGAE